MKKWNRWQDWVTVAAGLFAALSVLWTQQEGMSRTLMVVFGTLLVVSGLVNLAMPGTPLMEWVQAILAAGLILSPWLGSYEGYSAPEFRGRDLGAVLMEGPRWDQGQECNLGNLSKHRNFGMR